MIVTAARSVPIEDLADEVAAMVAAAKTWQETTRVVETTREERTYQITRLDHRYDKAETAAYLEKIQGLQQATFDAHKALIDATMRHCNTLRLDLGDVLTRSGSLR